MPSSDGSQPLPLTTKLSHVVERHGLWLLVGCYVVASLWPSPGRVVHGWHWTLGVVPNDRLTVPLLMLALMLFCAALLADVSQIRTIGQRPAALLWGLLAVWLGPALLVVAAGWIVPRVIDGDSTAGLMVGMALVASMPVANSSVGWTQNARGNLALSLALVLVSILICPWLTPQLLGVLGLSLSPAEQAHCDALVTSFSGAFFVVWVILPTAAGIACRHLIGARRADAAADVVRLVSMAALLVLNYVNASLALPDAFRQPGVALATTIVLAVTLSVVGLLSGAAIARLLRLPADSRAALLFGLSMKHTGLALLLAGAVLANEPLAILLIVLATLAQHLLAGVVQWQQRS